MNNYPDKTCTIDRLIRQPELIKAAIEGTKTQQRRDGMYAYKGETFELNEVSFIVTRVQHQTLAEMTDIDARAEGFLSLDDYKHLILKMHPGMVWNLEHKVWVHHFIRCDLV